MVLLYMKDWLCLSSNGYCNRQIKSHYAHYERVVERHHFKILLAGVAFLGLCCLGFKSADFEHDLVRLWIYNSSRLHNETSFVRRHFSDHIYQDSIETVLQVSRENILSTEFFLEHLQLMRLIVNQEISYDGKMFTLQNICKKISLPRMHYLDDETRANIEGIMPCEIVSPLHCFWEGSKMLPINEPIHLSEFITMNIDWTKFDFKMLLNEFKESFDRDFFIKLFNDSGVGRGYITKPCIDTTDPLCRNKNSKPLNFEKILKNGCFQIAENLYNYPKASLIGEHNRAMQSMILIRSADNVFRTMRSGNFDWSLEKTQQLINLWQAKMRQIVIKYNKQRPYLESITYNKITFQTKRVERSSFYAFTNNSLPIALDEANDDHTLVSKYLVCGGLVALLVVIFFLSSDDPVRSHCWLAMAGTTLAIMAMVAGLGLSAAFGLRFSVLTVKVIPFVMLGLGVEDVLVFTTCYSRASDRFFMEKTTIQPLYYTLYSCASTVLLSFLVKVSVIGGVAFVPVPLMRNFCGQVLMVTIYQSGTVALLYPCLLYLDHVRQLGHRMDVLCCLLRQLPTEDPPNDPENLPRYDIPNPRTIITSSQVVFSTEFTTSSDDLIPNNVRQYVEINPAFGAPHQSQVPARQTPRPQNQRLPRHKSYQCCWKYRYRLSKTFLHIMAFVPVHITIVLLTIAVIVFGLYSAIQVNCGLNLQSIFLRGSNEYNYVKYESLEFSFDNFDILVKSIDYVSLQGLLLQLHDEVQAVKNVQVFGNGKFWLTSFIVWLERLQSDLEADLRLGLILPNGRWLSNASSNGLLAMTLLVQDRGTINFQKLTTTKLVQSHRVDHKNFYLYLNVWRSVSVYFDNIPCILSPQMNPLKMENFTPTHTRRTPLVIKLSEENLYDSNRLQFVTCKYFHRGVEEKDDLSFVKTIRTITSRFTEKGVASIPLGNMFSLSEQYMSLRYHLMIASIISVVGVFLVSLLTMNHLLVTLLICLLFCSSLFSPLYFLSVYHLPLNATSGVMALWSGGLGIRLSLYVIVSYSEQSALEPSSEVIEQVDDDGGPLSPGPENQLQARMRRAVVDSPCASVIFGSLVSLAFISMTRVTFVWEHFLLLPLVGLFHATFNCYCLAPVLCFYLLPKTFLQPTMLEHGDCLLSRTTSSSRSHSSARRKRSRTAGRAHRSDPVPGSIFEKLSTIPEESSSVRSSTQSHQSKENASQSDQAGRTRGQPQYIEQDVQSTMSVQYPSAGPELEVKTSFKYRVPVVPGS